MSFVSTQHDLPAELRDLQGEIEGHARAFGLDFYSTIFEVLDYDELSEIAALGGFPTRYPHWRFGMEYEQLSKGYRYGLQKIYEMVINNDPCYAYLLRCNQTVDQKLVMAHVYGHNDFFKNNICFAPTNRKMMDEMANHGSRIRSHMERHGEEKVEDFIDSCLCLDSLIDIHSPFIKRRDAPDRYDFGAGEAEGESASDKFRSKEYMDPFVNPPEALREAARAREAERVKARRFPEHPERDVLLFLLEHAPLNPWQHEILAIVREEAYYFAPQGQTKIMNEGWASYWHSTMMTTKLLDGSELVDYADHHSGTMATQPGRLNPYKLGIELLRDIEERWDKGRFGPEFDACDDLRGPADLGHRRRPRPPEDLRGPSDPQRRDLHRHLPDARLLPTARDVQLPPQRPFGALRDREPRVRADQGAAPLRADQLRQADHPRPGRQLPEPRRAVPGAGVLRDRPEARPRPGHAPAPPPASGRARSTWRPASRGARPFSRSTARITPSAPWEASPMSLSTEIAAALDARAGQAGVVAAQDGPDRLELSVAAAAPIGVELDRLDFAVLDPARPCWSIQELRAWGERIARRVTYLMEPLVVVEVDAQGGEVEIRSHSPTPRGQLRSFFEVRLGVAGTPPDAPPPLRRRRRTPPSGRLPAQPGGPGTPRRRPPRRRPRPLTDAPTRRERPKKTTRRPLDASKGMRPASDSVMMPPAHRARTSGACSPIGRPRPGGTPRKCSTPGTM